VKEENSLYDVVVIGGGPAGLASAIHSSVFGLHTLVLETNERAGGAAARARGIANYPGFRKILGLKLMEKMIRQAEKNGVEFHVSEEAIGLSLHGKDKTVETAENKYRCKALILATGDAMRGIGMKWETWIGAGVAYCAECGAPYFNKKEILVIGNVEEAVDEALLLTRVAEKVTLVNHANMIEISSQTRKKLEEEHVLLLYDLVGKEIKGDPPSKQVVLKHAQGSATETLKADMILVIAGVKPFVSALRRAGIKTHRQGCIVVDGFGRTNIKGVFATGGCASTVKDLIPACVGDGAAVATCARLYVAYER
jgi:thioredoxin reductase (NADPH)